MRRRYLATVAVTVMFIGGCEMFRSASEDDIAVEDPAETAEDEAQRIVEAVGQLRGWEFEAALQPGEAKAKAPEVPQAVREEWSWFEKMLFGGEEIELRADDKRWAERVAYDTEAGTLVFAGDPRSEEDSALGLAMKAGMIMEGERLGGLAEVETVDQWFAREIIRRAGPAFVASVQAADRVGSSLTIDQVAERPELVAHLPGVGERLEAMGDASEMMQQAQLPEGTEWLEGAVEQLVLRKALSVGASLYRSGSWPALEWGRSEPPQVSAQVVHPQRWFAGEGSTQVHWPEGFEEWRAEEGWEEVRRGGVGPAVTSLWLEGLVGTRAARTIYGGWRSDSYRIYTRGEGAEQERVFHWVMTWESPQDAQQMAAAAESVLSHYLGREYRRNRFRTASKGLNVAISIYDVDRDPEELNREVELLAGSRMAVMPEDPAPFQFVPTLYDRYVERTGASTLDLDQETWTDRASGWQTTIEALSGWTVQRANEPHVRWFANYPDGTLIQWTTELVDPLQPEFGSDAYLEKLASAFSESLSAQEEPEVELVDAPQDPTVRMEIAGELEGRSLMLRLWQWRSGDVLVTYSVQGPEAFFGRRLDEAEAVLKGLVPRGEAVVQEEYSPETDPVEDEGIIEFRVDDE